MQNIYKRGGGGYKNRQARECKIVSVKLILNTGVKKNVRLANARLKVNLAPFPLHFCQLTLFKSHAFNYPKFQRFLTSQGTNLWIFTLTFCQAYIYRYWYTGIQNIIKHCVLYFMNIRTVSLWYLLFYDNSLRCCLWASIKHNSKLLVLSFHSTQTIMQIL